MENPQSSGSLEHSVMGFLQDKLWACALGKKTVLWKYLNTRVESIA